jgi:phage terminase large subunit
MAQDVVIEYVPNEKQALFHQASEDYVLYGGAKGGGKSCALVEEAIAWGYEHNGANMYIFRETYDALEQNIIREFKEKIPKELYKYNEGKHRAVLLNGTVINFRHVNSDADAAIYQGVSMDWLGIDELTKHSEKAVQILLSCLRSAKGYKPKFRATCNPGGKGHVWVRDTYILATDYGKKVIKDPIYGVTIRFIPATVYDNTVLMANDPVYVKRLENLPDNEKRAFLYGDWDIFEGRFFGEWNEKTHVVAPFDIPREWRKAVSIDWGFNDYCDVLWHAMDGDHVYTYRELHVKGKSVREVARDIKMLTGFDEKIDYYVGSPDMWQTRGTGETIGSQNIADIFASERIYFQKANNSRVVGWQVMREYMLNAKDETPKWKIFSSCQNIIRCLPLAQYDDDKMEDMSTEPHEITDALDSARYFFMTRPSSKRISMENKPMNYTPSEVEDFLSGSTKETRKHDSVDRRRVWKQ